MRKSAYGRDGEENGSGRDALFSSRKNGAATKGANPYAQEDAASDPYMNNGGGAPPPAYSRGSTGGSADRFRNDRSPAPSAGSVVASGDGAGLPGPGGPGGPGAGRYAAGGNYGNSGAGQNRFDNPASEAPGSRYGTGGYGGFGRGPAPAGIDPEASRQALFGNAVQRDEEQGPIGRPVGQNEWDSGRGPGYGNSQGYGAYSDRQLTAEEQEEEDIQASKQEIRFVKQQDVASTRNALRVAAMAEETGRQTLERLGAQGERIHNTERNLDLASNQNRLASEKARELKTLNRSMFAVHVSNPFTSARRTREREENVLEQSRKDRDERDATRHEAWSSSARQTDVSRELNKAGGISSRTKTNLAERAKYQFEADSEDEAMEDEIDQNLGMLHGAAKRLNTLAGAMGREVDEQNKHIDRIGGKVDRVDDEIALNRSRLDRIK